MELRELFQIVSNDGHAVLLNYQCLKTASMIQIISQLISRIPDEGYLLSTKDDSANDKEDIIIVYIDLVDGEKYISSSESKVYKTIKILSQILSSLTSEAVNEYSNIEESFGKGLDDSGCSECSDDCE